MRCKERAFLSTVSNFYPPPKTGTNLVPLQIAVNVKNLRSKAMIDRANNIQAAFNPVYQLLKMGLAPACDNYEKWVAKVDRLKRLTRNLNMASKQVI